MKWIIYVYVICIAYSMQAQVSFTTEVSREKLGINERLRVDFIIDKDADNFKAPNFEGFRKLSGPNQSIEQRYEYGKASFKKTYTFFLQPMKRGQLEIGQAEIEYGGTLYKSPPKTVEVTAAVDNPNSSSSVAASQVDDAIHLVAEVSNTKPYLNEGVYIVYKLFIDSSINIRNYRPIDEPTFKDFWSQNIDIDQLQFKEGEYAGRPYRYVELRKTILYPQKTGELKVEPLTIGVSVEVPTNRRDIFGRRQYELVEKTFSAQTRVFNVKPLPEAGKPLDFTGAVGQFSIQVEPSKNELDVNESLSATVKISGKGNLALFNPPALKVPNSIEVYDPERQDRINTTASGMTGYISERYTLVPQFEGDYKIGGVSFSYFDPRAETYKQLTSNAFALKVNPDPTAVANNQNNVTRPSSNTSSNQQAVILPESQFSYIELSTKLKPSGTTAFFNSNIFWTLTLLPYLCIPLLLVTRKRWQSHASSQPKAQQVANRLAKKYLSEAKNTLQDQDKFYEALERALHNYLKAKLKIQTAEMSKEKIKETLSSRGVEQDSINDFVHLLQACEWARYTPNSSAAKQEDYQKAAQTIGKIDKAL